MLSEKPWKPDLVGRLLLGIIALFALGMMLIQALKAIRLRRYGIDMEMIGPMAGTMAIHVITLVLVGIFVKQHSLTWNSAFGFREPGFWRTIRLAAIVGMAVLPVAWTLTYLTSEIMKFIQVTVEQQQAVQILQKATTTWEKYYYFVAAVIMAPIVEETIFRGILYPMLKRTGRQRMAVWVSAFIFAAIHTNVLTFVPLTFLAVVLALLYETTGNLCAPIFAHSLFNAANYFLLNLQGTQAGS